MINCDWCGGPMRRIGDVETGMLRGHASVWLCWCGHEREIFDDRLPLAYWRDALVFAIWVRAHDLHQEDRDRRWKEILSRCREAHARARQLLGETTTPLSRAASTED